MHIRADSGVGRAEHQRLRGAARVSRRRRRTRGLGRHLRRGQARRLRQCARDRLRSCRARANAGVHAGDPGSDRRPGADAGPGRRRRDAHRQQRQQECERATDPQAHRGPCRATHTTLLAAALARPRNGRESGRMSCAARLPTDQPVPVTRDVAHRSRRLPLEDPSDHPRRERSDRPRKYSRARGAVVLTGATTRPPSPTSGPGHPGGGDCHTATTGVPGTTPRPRTVRIAGPPGPQPRAARSSRCARSD